MCTSDFEVTLFRATFSLAFFGAFRCSELVAGFKGDHSGRALEVSDISTKNSELCIHLHKSKTDQLTGGGGASYYTLPKRGRFARCIAQRLSYLSSLMGQDLY